MKPSAQRLLSLVIALAMIFAAIVIYFNLTMPEYDSADIVRGDVYARQEFVDGQKSAIEQVQKLIADYSSNSGLKNTISMALPFDINEAGIFHTIRGLAELNRMAIKSFSISQPAAQNIGNTFSGVGSSTAVVRPVGIINFQFRVAGAYEDFKSFLGNLETNIRIFDLRSITVAPSDDADRNNYEFDIGATAYYQNK